MDRPWLIALPLALLAIFAPSAQAALSADSMLAPDAVVAIDMELPPASVAALEVEPGEYVEGTLAVAEASGPDAVGEFTDPITVGIRLKGNASFEPLSGKAAFKLKFNEFVKGQKFLGLKKLTLNHMTQDPSMLREALSYEAFRTAGIAAPRTGYAYVRVNGEDFGLHLNVETMDDLALERWIGPFDDPQHLYEGGAAVDVLPGGAGAFEVDEGDGGDLGDLEALIAAANEPTPDFSTRMAGRADLEQMARMWALERYLGQWDGYTGAPNNYYLFSDPDGVFQMLPWGADQVLYRWWMPFSIVPEVGVQGGALFKQCLLDPACEKAYREELAAIGELTTALDLPARMEAITALLAPWQAQEVAESERAPFAQAQIDAGVAQSLYFLAVRPELLAGWLETGEMPDPKDPADPPAPEVPGQPAGETPNDQVVDPPDPPPALSRRLQVDRSGLGRGLLVTRVAVAAAGTIRQVGQIVTRSGRLRACVVRVEVGSAGAPVVRCRLTAAVRKRLALRHLTLRLQTHFTSAEGDAAEIDSAVVIPRQSAPRP